MRSLGAKFSLGVGLFVLAFSSFAFYRTWTAAKQQTQTLIHRQAELALVFDLAIRKYVGEEIRPRMRELVAEGEFVPETMSTSFVARSVFDEVRKDFPDYIIKFSSDHPRNPANLAGPEELEIVDFFNENPEESKWVGEIQMEGKPYVAYFSARRMKAKCLRCHGKPEDAPASLVERYGATAGFHRPVGEIVATDTIAIPVDKVNAALATTIIRQFAIAVVGMCLLFGAILLVFRVVVTRRLALMGESFRQTAAQREWREIAPVTVAGRDEISVLAVSFNALAEKVREAHASLEKRVDDRTRELEGANRELARQAESLGAKNEQLEKARTSGLNMMSDMEMSRREAERAKEETEEVNRELEASVERVKLFADEAAAANRSKSEFLANMSHEIRTPMTAILGFADVLLEQGDLEQAPPERIEAAKTIRRNGEYLLRIINDILDLSKVEAGKMSVRRVPCEPCKIIAEVVSLVRVKAEDKRLVFGIEYIGAAPETIRTDPTRLRQILINLIGNAIKFTEAGGVRLITRLVDGAHEPVMQFDVVDTGLGMTREQVARLFRPFTQADASTTRQFGGTGLGLTISKRFAEMLGGDVTVVDSQRGIGTRFRATVTTGLLDGVRMIEDPMSATAVAADATEACECAAPTSLQGSHVLLAEDGLDNQRLIGHVLTKAGTEVTIVENGELAVDAALAAHNEGRPFDVILMDMQMPVMDGYRAVGLLRQGGYTGVIIALTAHAMGGDREKCIQAGCDAYASKPINLKGMIEMIHKHIHAGAVF